MEIDNEIFSMVILTHPLIQEGQLSICAQVQVILKAPITAAADNILKYFFFNFPKKTSLDISCVSSAKQTIHMKYQDLFSLKNWKKKNKCRLLQILLGALRVKHLED